MGGKGRRKSPARNPTQRQKKRGVGWRSKSWSYIKKHHLALLGLSLTALGFFTWYLGFTSPNIYHVTGPYELETTEVRDMKDKTEMLVIVGATYKNYSFREGYIDKAEIAQTNLRAVPEVKVLDMGKEIFSWREKKTIRLQLLLTFVEPARSQYKLQRETVKLRIKLYDNNGRIIQEPHGHAHVLDIVLSANKPGDPDPPTPPPH